LIEEKKKEGRAATTLRREMLCLVAEAASGSKKLPDGSTFVNFKSWQNTACFVLLPSPHAFSR